MARNVYWLLDVQASSNRQTLPRLTSTCHLTPSIVFSPIFMTLCLIVVLLGMWRPGCRCMYSSKCQNLGCSTSSNGWLQMTIHLVSNCSNYPGPSSCPDRVFIGIDINQVCKLTASHWLCCANICTMMAEALLSHCRYLLALAGFNTFQPWTITASSP